ncbi:MAG: hypothetical protein NVSMB51_12960 [Solirubrobacteraceae bacterium]
MTLKLVAIIVPLGLDTFAVSLALGLVGMSPGRRLRLSLLFAGFEAAMPLVGVALGAPLGRAIGRDADYAAVGLLAALGLYMLFGGDAENGEVSRLRELSQRGLLSAAALGLSISLDELAIGFSAGLLRLPVVEMVAAIAAQAFIVAQAGVRLGERFGGRLRELSERLAGAALVVLALTLAAL